MAPDGLVIVDKPAGWTSHDVVARMRRLAGTRKVGHAGTLDPMATGVLVIGVGRATRLLGHFSLASKAYVATMRLGATTVTDDSEGEVVATADASGVSNDQIHDQVGVLTGEIRQVPSKVSAIKIDGVRSYRRVRDGHDVDLPAREVTVSRFDVLDIRRGDQVIDVDVVVECSSGTYVRALARDIGAALSVGGHLTALRRTRVGPFGVDLAHTLEQLAESLDLMPIAEAAGALFPRFDVDADTAARVAHGGHLMATGLGPGPVAVFGPDGALLSLVEDHGPRAKHLAVFV